MKKNKNFTEKEIARIKAMSTHMGATEIAKKLTKDWGKKVSRHNVRYWRDNEVQDLRLLSEDESKIKEASRTECITELRRIAELDESKIITRNYFRNNSNLAESAWNKHFGTFQEFKASAKVTLTRHAKAMERAVAKHASVDKLRQMNLEKHDWSDRYQKPDGKRFKTTLVGSDIHDIECCPFWRRLFIDTAARVQPSRVVLNGDIFDLPEFGSYSVDPREWDVVGRIKWVHKFLEDLREVLPDAEIDFIEGNHEYRLLRHLAEASPAMQAVLGDLHGWTVPDLLGLSKYEVNYTAPADLATFTKGDAKAQIRRNYKILDDFLVAHHFPEGNKFGLPGWNGHHHSHIAQTHFSPVYGAYEWHQLGSGHKREASYCNGEKWTNGFLLVHADVVEKRAQFEYIDTTNDHTVIGGKWYTRGENE